MEILCLKYEFIKREDFFFLHLNAKKCRWMRECMCDVWKANNYFSIIKIISNAQFFISNWLAAFMYFFKTSFMLFYCGDQFYWWFFYSFSSIINVCEKLNLFFIQLWKLFENEKIFCGLAD